MQSKVNLEFSKLYSPANDKNLKSKLQPKICCDTPNPRKYQRLILSQMWFLFSGCTVSLTHSRKIFVFFALENFFYRRPSPAPPFPSSFQSFTYFHRAEISHIFFAMRRKNVIFDDICFAKNNLANPRKDNGIRKNSSCWLLSTAHRLLSGKLSLCKREVEWNSVQISHFWVFWIEDDRSWNVDGCR